MDIRKLKRQLKLLSRNDLEIVYEELYKFVDRDHDLFDELVTLDARLKNLIKDQRLGLLNYEDYNNFFNRIQYSTLYVINKLDSNSIYKNGYKDYITEELKESISDDQLLAKIYEIRPQIKFSTALYQVSCNRASTFELAWQAFNQFQKQNEKMQFYFLSACSTQRPTSFSERFIYELSDHFEYHEEKQKIFKYWTETYSDRIEIFPLPYGRTLKASKVKFLHFFYKRIGLKGKHQDIETFLENLSSIPFDVVSMVFSVRGSGWQHFFPDFFQWIINLFSFQSKFNPSPSFFFFFVFELKNLHKQSFNSLPLNQKKIVEELGYLVDVNINNSIYISNFHPVAKDYVKDWLNMIGERNDGTQEHLVKLIAAQNTLSSEDRDQFINEKTLNMDDIERFQKYLLDYGDQKNNIRQKLY